MKRSYYTLGLVILGGFLLATKYYTNSQILHSVTKSQTVGTSLLVSSQIATSSVVINSVTLPTAGFLAV